MVTYFINRDKCPACSSDKIKIIYQKPFNEDPLWNYLCSAYLIQDDIDSKYFEGANYCLCECEVCRLIFHQEILNDILMERLYEIGYMERVFKDSGQEKVSFLSILVTHKK